jgi:hypothetical protein
MANSLDMLPQQLFQYGSGFRCSDWLDELALLVGLDPSREKRADVGWEISLPKLLYQLQLFIAGQSFGGSEHFSERHRSPSALDSAEPL